jgi:hypothetical protein
MFSNSFVNYYIYHVFFRSFVILIMAPLAQILVTSTLARSNTLWLSTSASRSSSDAAARGARFTEA